MTGSTKITTSRCAFATSLLVLFTPYACGGQATSSSDGRVDSGGGDTGSGDAGATGPARDASPAMESGAPASPPGFYTVLESAGCLPQVLPAGDAGLIACDVFEVLGSAGATCDPAGGLSAVDPAQAAAVVDAIHSTAATPPTVCELAQIAEVTGGTCVTSASSGWCYVTGAGAEGCPQKIVFSPGTPEPGAIVVLGCPGH